MLALLGFYPLATEARCANMSKMSCVRFKTGASMISAKLPCCAGDSSLSNMISSSGSTIAPSSSALPFPINVAGSGMARFCTNRSTTSKPASSANSQSSSRLSSTSQSDWPGSCRDTKYNAAYYSTSPSYGRNRCPPPEILPREDSYGNYNAC